MVPVYQRQATSEEKRCALDEVLNSVTLRPFGPFEESAALPGESEIEGRASELNEYAIGVQALGQPAGYSPAENSAVRSRIHELRHRLDKFYATEAPGAPIQVQLLKGTYIPRFVRSEHAVAAVVEAPPSGAPAKRIWWSAAAAFVGGTLLMFAILRGPALAPAKSASGTPWTPELETIWSPFLDSKVPLLVSFESRLFVRIGNVAVRDWSVDEMARVESSQRLMGIKDLFLPFSAAPTLYENRNYADFGAVQAAFSIARLLGTRNPQLLLKRSSGVGPDDARDNDVIFLSKPSTDPVLRQLLARGPFVDERLRVRNLDPKAGELAEYVARPIPRTPTAPANATC